MVQGIQASMYAKQCDASTCIQCNVVQNVVIVQRQASSFIGMFFTLRHIQVVHPTAPDLCVVHTAGHSSGASDST